MRVYSTKAGLSISGSDRGGTRQSRPSLAERCFESPLREFEIVWSSGGKDIFTEGFRLLEDEVEAVDFNRETYLIDICSGQSRLVTP